MYTLLLDGVAVRAARLQQVTDYARGTFTVAAEKVLSDQAAMLLLLSHGRIVLIDNHSVLVTDGYGAVQLLGPVRYYHNVVS